jgi:D-alanyl-D-alanine carboxypeptidase/D-alanyl-D-alanine-endopeptidase (penicillin-binding protein 4)
MKDLKRIGTLILWVAVVGSFGALRAFPQASGTASSGPQSGPKPLLQDIKVHGDEQASYDDTLVKKTASIAPVAAVRANSPIPALADVEIPGYTGILIEKMDGTNIVEIGSDLTFNPASNVKIATAYAVLRSFGPDYRFPTNVWTDGTLDTATGTLTGNIYVSGRDPIFSFENGVVLANELNRLGIRSVQGDLIVTDDFAMNYSSSAVRTSQTLFATLDASRRSPAATRAWLNFLSNSRQYRPTSGIPGVTFTGAVYVQPITSNAQLLFTHESAPMRDILKATLCYSNNFLAERLGDMLGGSSAVGRIVQLNAGIDPGEFFIQTSSGLGINRVTPAAMMKLLRAFRDDLARFRMTFADVMPVAGVDKGTLEERFDTDFSRGSLVGKTGTLGQTDGGVSTLAGEINTKNGRLLFVIFNQRGSPSRFRTFQNFFVSLVQGQFGGAAPLKYTPVALDARLATNRVLRPSMHAAIKD